MNSLPTINYIPVEKITFFWVTNNFSVLDLVFANR